MADVRPIGKLAPFTARHRNDSRMTDENDQSIDHIIRLANSDVGTEVSSKIGRSLTNDESQAIAAIIGNEYFWARAEELLMFVRHKTAGEVQNMVATLAIRFREGTLPTNDDVHARPARVIHCDMCGSTGVCYCIRKGPGTAVGCPRCSGTEKCRHCNGTGTG